MAHIAAEKLLEVQNELCAVDFWKSSFIQRPKLLNDMEYCKSH